jgi:hypothetical protein
MRSLKLITCLCACICAFAASAFAWSGKEHILIARCAVRELLDDPATPADMKQWLRQAQPALGHTQDEHQFLLHGHVGLLQPQGVEGLAYWAVWPDLQADNPEKLAPFNVPEARLHFVDVELFMPDKADRTFAADLSHKPRFEDIPRDMKDPRWSHAGMLPFRIENCYQQTVTMFRQNRLAPKPGQAASDDTAVKWAGMLAHYAADNTMPMHATSDYQAYSFFPGIDKKPKVHFDMEYVLVDGETQAYPEIRESLWKAFTAELAATPAPSLKPDVWTTSLQLSLASYDHLPLIGHAAQTAYLDAAGHLKPFDAQAFCNYREAEGKPTLLQIKAHQWALAVKWIETLWLHAWQDAHAPAN